MESVDFGIEMLPVPAGMFEMGSAKGDKDAYIDEMPRHLVKVNAFKLDRTEVTQGQWKAVMGYNPAYFKQCGDNCPVERVSFGEVLTFIKKLNELTGKNYRLPTEAEWEYACRSGGGNPYCGGDEQDSVAWYSGNSGNTTSPVGLKRANAWGFYDMSGNVGEWTCSAHVGYAMNLEDGEEPVCPDYAEKRVSRGGSWDFGSRNVRSAFRNEYQPKYGFNDLGFRVALGPKE